MRKSETRGMRAAARSGGMALALALLVTSGLLAHDFWIVPVRFDVTPGDSLEVHGQSGTRFPTSQSAVAVDRVVDARLLASRGEERVADLTVTGTSLVMRHAPSRAGQRVVVVSLAPASRRVSAAALKRYIALEGAPELAERYDRAGAFASLDSATMRTQKFAKAIIEVGQRGPRAFSRTAGQGLEIIPVTDPAGLHPGGEMAVRLVFRGNALAGAHLRAGPAADSPSGEGVQPDTVLVTDNDGVARLRVAEGMWNIRTLHAGPSHTNPREWDVFFSTLVFNVAGHR